MEPILLKRGLRKSKGDSANLSAYSTKFNPTLTSADEPFNWIEPNKTSFKSQVYYDKREP
ncbi:hypothetical protein HBZC1_03930 [Helicobacter bizzozeronii CIII-1]|uniref:Uncharacterized protein n=1 Tax=Helicobacter bizzozeronii (strain CIII-1) TaxID=1002804 RepID=F8KRJ2_HELBC|nr:hypothetical protein [Helicobacter bizzozeronii]CCB79379.1 hypothetical protein HBZC1_03930 [Helicobacter bizzozeronii CIII-1]